MTQAALAESVGLSTAYISQLERGARGASLDALDALARAFKVTPAQLLAAGEDGSGDRTPDSGVEVLLRAWPESERAELVTILVALRKVARTSPKTSARSKPNRRR